MARPVLVLLENDRFVPVEQDAVLDMPAYGSREHDLLQVPALLDQILDRVTMRYARYALLDDRPVIEHFRNIVCRGADDFHTAIKSLLVWLRPNKRGQEGMMDIDDLLRILLDEVLGEHLHIPGQDDQLDIVLAKQLHLPLFSLQLAFLRHWNEVIRNVVKVCMPFRVRMIANHQRNFTGEFANPLPVKQVYETVIIF